jgi:hypothetical protein
MNLSITKLSQNPEDDRGILMSADAAGGSDSSAGHIASFARRLAALPPGRIENRFLLNHRDPFTNHSLWCHRSGAKTCWTSVDRLWVTLPHSPAVSPRCRPAELKIDFC